MPMVRVYQSGFDYTFHIFNHTAEKCAVSIIIKCNYNLSHKTMRKRLQLQLYEIFPIWQYRASGECQACRMSQTV